MNRSFNPHRYGREVGGQAARVPAKTQISALYSDERPWCQAPHCARGGGDTGWFLTGFTGLRDDGRNAEGAEDAKRGTSVTNIHVIPSQEPITLD
jgi:hypothetical protein